MLQLGLSSKLKCQLHHWYGVTLSMKELIGLLGKLYLTSCEMHVVVMKTTEPDSTREATERLLKRFEITYAKEDFKQLANNATHINAEEITKLLRLLKYFEDLFDGTLGYCDTVPVKLDPNSGSKPFNSKYYLVPRINKKTFPKNIKCLAKIGVLTPVQQIK